MITVARNFPLDEDMRDTHQLATILIFILIVFVFVYLYMETISQLPFEGILYEVSPRLLTGEATYRGIRGVTNDSGELCLNFRQEQA